MSDTITKTSTVGLHLRQRPRWAPRLAALTAAGALSFGVVACADDGDTGDGVTETTSPGLTETTNDLSDGADDMTDDMSDDADDLTDDTEG